MAAATPATLRALTVSRGGYATPRLNDVLHAARAGLGSLGGGGLQAYDRLAALHLEGNGLVDLEGLPTLPKLRCL